MNVTPFANLASNDYFAGGFAFGNNYNNNFCCIARNFHPLGWTPSTTTSTSTSTTFTTSTTTTAVSSTTTSSSSSSSTSTSTTSVPLTTTTTTTVPVCSEGYLYDIELYSCEDCSLSGTGGLSNNEPLTINKWYYYPSLQAKVRIISFSQCFGFGVSIPDSTKKDTCSEVICPTTTTTTTVFETDLIQLNVNSVSFVQSRLGITNMLDPTEWNDALDNWWGDETDTNFTSIEIIGNVIKLKGNIGEITTLFLGSLGVNDIIVKGILSSATTFRVDDNNLTVFHYDNAYLPVVEVLDVANNLLTVFDPGVALPTSLQLIRLERNDLTGFNPTIPLPEGLNNMHLEQNAIASFNPTIPLPSTLDILELSNNLIPTFNLTHPLPANLHVLQLYNNQLTSVIIPTPYPPVLITYTLGFNHLTTVDANLITSFTLSFGGEGNDLNTATVNSILARAVALGIHSTPPIVPYISLNGGTNACPTGQGVIDKATLEAAGVIVPTNVCTTTTTTTAVPTTTTTTTCALPHSVEIFIPSSVAGWPTLTKTLSDTCGALACIQASSCSVNGAFQVWIDHALPLLINDHIYSTEGSCILFSDGFYIFNNGGGNIIIEIVNGTVISFPTCPTTTTTSTTTVVSFTYNTSTFSCSDCSPIATGVQLPNNSMLLSINGWFYNPATGLKIRIVGLLSSPATPPTSFINNDDSVGSCALVSCPTTTTTTTA